MRSLILALAAATVLATGAGWAGAAQNASLPDIEDEVMCPTCGVPLEHAFSPQADRERNFIRTQIEQGQTKQQIKDSLVAEFGPDVLAVPRKSGFDLAAYIVPVLAVLFAAIALGLGLWRWRRRPPAQPVATEAVSSSDASRLEQDLSRYDL